MTGRLRKTSYSTTVDDERSNYETAGIAQLTQRRKAVREQHQTRRSTSQAGESRRSTTAAHDPIETSLDTSDEEINGERQRRGHKDDRVGNL
jgi:hypothetical protein